MEEKTVKLPPDLCEHLLSKNLVLGNTGSDPALLHPDEELPSEPYWCALTQEALGPDDELVGPAHCRAGRPCCTPRTVPRA